MGSTKTSAQVRRNKLGTERARCESLEGRTLFAGTQLYLTEITTAAGPALSIDGSPGDDRISVVAYGDTIMLANKGGWSLLVPNHYVLIQINAAKGNDVLIVDGSITTDTILRGSNGDDTIMGGAGDDRIYGGYGRDRILGGAGDDTIVTIGDSIRDRVSGDDGFDNFWTDVHRSEVITDASPEELTAGSVHRVTSFFMTPTAAAATSDDDVVRPSEEDLITASRDLAGQDLPDPAPIARWMSTANYGDRPLFSDAGPAPTDINQGGVGDCYFLATLASIAQQSPDLLRQAITELGDGTYAVRYHRDGLPVYIRVDADLTTYFAKPAYAELGAQQSLWVALMEKAYAFFRTGEGTYRSIVAGWMSEVFTAMGLPSNTIWWTTTQTPAELLTHLKVELDAGAAITWATWEIPAGVPLVGLHAYSINAITLDDEGNPLTVTLRNPWGIDGGGNRDEFNDGLVTLTVAQMAGAFSALMYARV